MFRKRIVLCSLASIAALALALCVAPLKAQTIALDVTAAANATAAPLPKEAQAAISAFQEEQRKIYAEAEAKLVPARKALSERLEAVAAKLDAAGEDQLAAHVRSKRAEYTSGLDAKDPLPQTQNLLAHKDRIGQSLYFKITGRTTGSVWGSGPYTNDSDLATAAVHAGAIKDGETAVIKVTLSANENAYKGSKQNGVTTSDWGPFQQGSFKVEKDK